MAKILAFFNNKGGVGKTSLVYHLAWMYSELRVRVVAADLDPQANLTTAFLDDDRLEELWPDGEHPWTILGCIRPLLKGTGDIGSPHLDGGEEGPGLVVGDLGLSGFEDQLSQDWPLCLDGKERAFRVISAFWRILQQAAVAGGADLVLMDLGPNLGAINRAALLAADSVVVPLAPDLFSLQGLQNLGPTLRRWREEWKDRRGRNPAPDLPLPEGRMEPAGYVVMQHSVRLDRPVKAYDRWIARIPSVYRISVLDQRGEEGLTVRADPECLALLKHYHSLMPLAQTARKPMFQLKPGDGAIGAHVQAVGQAYKDFESLARRIAGRIGLAVGPG